MPPSEERMKDDPCNQSKLITSSLSDTQGTKDKNVNDDDEGGEEEDDDSSILLIDCPSSHDSGNDLMMNGCDYYASNLDDSHQKNHVSILTEGFASHDSITFDPQELMMVDSNGVVENDCGDDDGEGVKPNNSDNHTKKDDHTNINHRIVLYYNSNTGSSTKTLSLVDVRNRLMKNLQFIKDVKARLGPFVDANSEHFTMEYCDVADRETGRLLQKQFGNHDVDGDDDNATVITTSSLMVSLPAIVIDHRIMIPYSEQNWATIVMDYMILLRNLVDATEPDDTSLISRLSPRCEQDHVSQNEVDTEATDDNEIYDDELNEYDLSMHIQSSNNDNTDEDNSESFNHYFAMDQYYKEASASNRDLMGRNNVISNTTNSCTTTNDSTESSVTQVTTNLTRRTTSSSRLQSLLEPFNNSCHDNSIEKEVSPSHAIKTKVILPSDSNPPTETIQFSSHDDHDLCDHTSFSTLSYTISSEVQQVKASTKEITIQVPKAAYSANDVSDPTEAKKEGVDTTTRIVGTAAPRPGQRLLTIPLTKQTISVAELTRQLMNVTTHRYQYIPQASAEKYQNAFRGFEGILIWKNLFGKQNTNSMKLEKENSDTNGDDKWIEFGLLLLSYGILHDYTPNETDFRRAYLAVQPLRHVFAMNTLLQWSPLKHENKSNVDGDAGHASTSEMKLSTILRLSRSVDAIVEKYKLNSTSCNHLLDEFEEAVCQLQVTPLPTDTASKMVAVLNLYNMIVRHAMLLTLCKKRKGWTWPTSLEELDLLLEKIGYVIDGKFTSASSLREYLFLGSDRFDFQEFTVDRKIISPRSNTWLGSSCLSGRRGVTIGRSNISSNVIGTGCKGGGSTNRWKKGLVEVNDRYEARRVVTDKRLLMALTWGTINSPAFHTVYPDQFDKALDEYAERYCQKHVIFTEDTSSSPSSGKVVTVTLPSLFSWYRNDFGTYRENVLDSIKQYLSVASQDKINATRHGVKLRIVFEAASVMNWSCGFPDMEMLERDIDCHLHSISHGTKVPKSTNGINKSAVVASKKIFDSARVSNESTGCSKEKKLPKVKDINWSNNLPLFKDITPGNRVYKKPSPQIHDCFDSSKKIEVKSMLTIEDCIASSALNPDVYRAHLNVTRNILGEMGMEHSCSLQNEVASNDCRDIVINGLNHLYSNPTDITTEYKNVDHNKNSEPKVNCREKGARVTPSSSQHDIQAGLFCDGLKSQNPIMKRSTNNTVDPLYGQGGSDYGKDSLALIQQWIGFDKPEPASARQTSQGDVILLPTIHAPSNARQTSLGDSILLPPLGRTKISPRTSAPTSDTTQVEYFLATENMAYDSNRRFDEIHQTSGQSFTFRSDVSAITFGSDFDALLRANSLPQLMHPPPSFSAMVDVRASMQHSMTASPTSVAYGQLANPPQLQK